MMLSFYCKNFLRIPTYFKVKKIKYKFSSTKCPNGKYILLGIYNVYYTHSHLLVLKTSIPMNIII